MSAPGSAQPSAPTSTQPVAEAPAPTGQGVVAAADGYRLIPASTTLDGDGGTFRFTIEDQHDQAVHDFTPVHERDLHLIVVNRELTTFHHVHPTLDADGTWSIDLPALDPGSYRAVADFQITDGPRLALGTDLTVAGQYQPTALPEPSTEATTDGYEVHLTTERSDDGELTAHLTVSRNGDIVTDLEPYLGASGHLVAMRSGDLAYAHVHPVDDDDRARGRHVRRRADLRRPVRPVLRLQAPRDGPHRLVHLRPGPRHRDARHGDVSPMTDTTTRPATTVALDIGGMTCASCAARITKRLNKLDGVDAIRELRHRTGHRHRPRRRHRRRDRRPGRSDRLHRQGPRRIAARHQRHRGRRP